jgi:hypothetical protein
MYIQQLREMVPSPSQKTVEVCNQITFLTLYIGSRLLTLFKVIEASIQVSDLFDTVSFKFIKFSFQIFLVLFLKCLLASHHTLFILSSLFWFVSCNPYILTCFLWSKNCEHSSSSYGLCCFISYRIIYFRF